MYKMHYVAFFQPFFVNPAPKKWDDISSIYCYSTAFAYACLRTIRICRYENHLCSAHAVFAKGLIARTVAQAAGAGARQSH